MKINNSDIIIRSSCIGMLLTQDFFLNFQGFEMIL